MQVNLVALGDLRLRVDKRCDSPWITRSNGADAEPFVYGGSNWERCEPGESDGWISGAGLAWDTVAVGALDAKVATAGCAEASRFLTSNDEPEISADRLARIISHDSRLSKIARDERLELVLSILSGNLHSTTFCPVRQRYVGLHFDDFGDHETRDVHLGSVRVSINFGKQSRYFCFAPVCFSDARDRMGQVSSLAGGQRMTGLAASYLLNQASPLFRVEIPPGHYYVAPTQNIIHDGQTSSTGDLDVSFSFRTTGVKASLLWT